MADDNAVIEALQAAVDADPTGHSVRLHLAGLQLLAGDADAALSNAGIVLVALPDSVEALALARDAAGALGDAKRAEAYGRLLGVARPDVAEAPRERALREPDRGASAFDELREIERPQVTLRDVGGLEAVKARLESAFLAPLRNPELREYYGKSLRGGLLLYGPPGCGKTFIARALAGELGAAFIAVGLSDVLDMWLGESERRLHEAFEVARRATPCVLFLDEIDALGRKRSQLRHSAGRNVINQLLAELDGVQAANEGLFVLAVAVA